MYAIPDQKYMNRKSNLLTYVWTLVGLFLHSCFTLNFFSFHGFQIDVGFCTLNYFSFDTFKYFNWFRYSLDMDVEKWEPHFDTQYIKWILIEINIPLSLILHTQLSFQLNLACMPHTWLSIYLSQFLILQSLIYSLIPIPEFCPEV